MNRSRVDLLRLGIAVLALGAPLVVPGVANASVEAAITFTLVRPDGAPAAGATVVTMAVGVNVPFGATADGAGVVRLPLASLAAVAAPSAPAGAVVNYLARAYDLGRLEVSAGTFPVPTAYVGFVLDPVTGHVVTTPDLNGATIPMSAGLVTFTDRRVDLDADPHDCTPVHDDSWTTCHYQQFHDRDLMNIKIPFITNYGGGEDMVSTIKISQSHTVKTEFVVKADGGKWAKGIGRLTTTKTDDVTLSTPESPEVGNAKFGVNRHASMTWDYVREKLKYCGFAEWFCTTDQTVRPEGWNGGTWLEPVQSPSYPYDQAGEPGPENLNCTTLADLGFDYGTGYDTSLSTVLGFSADGGFRDEMKVEVTWEKSTESGAQFNHTFKVVTPHAQAHHFVFAEAGLLYEPWRCPKDSIEITYTDASDHDLSNPGPGTVGPPPNVRCDETVPPQYKQAVCDPIAIYLGRR